MFELVDGFAARRYGGGRDVREIAVEEIRHDGGVHIAVLELDGNAVLLMHDHDVEQALQRPVLELLGQCRIGIDLRFRHETGGMAVAPLGDLLRDVAQFHEARQGGGLLHEGAHTRHAREEALGHQLAERPVRRHAADAEALDQFVLGGTRRPGSQAPERMFPRMWSFTLA
jgi:hypothetical protein